jgi:hypothetical protein
MEIPNKEIFEEEIFTMNMEVSPLKKAVIRQSIIRGIEKRGIEALDILEIISNDMLLELLSRKYPDDVCLIELIGRYSKVAIEGRK